jgi:DNA polymerase bacteriophage-type
MVDFTLLAKEVNLDFETRSMCDLKTAGADKYAQNVSTEIICLVYWNTIHDKLIWWPGQSPIGTHLMRWATNPNIIFVAHGAGFEQAIWKHIMVGLGWPEMPPERWDCTMAASLRKGFPAALDKGERAMRLNNPKDMEGSRLTVSLSKLNKKTGMLPELTPEIRQRVADYCVQDVDTEHSAEKFVNIISRESKTERAVWLLDQKINQRGVRLDLPFVNAAQLVVTRATAPLLQEFETLTGIGKVNSPTLKDWFLANGLAVENLQKETLAAILKPMEDDDELAGERDYERMQLDTLPENVRRVLQIRQMLGSASVKKLRAMLACVGYDGRARGLYQYYAAHSGRWGGRLFQPQNFIRRSIKGLTPDEVVAVIMSGDPGVVERECGMPAIEAVGLALRHAIVPDDGNVFIVGDYKAIEAVIVLAWAGHHDLAEKIASGAPVYFEMAEDIFKKPRGTWAVADKKLYQHYKEIEFVQEYTIGKNTILGCGFQMGAGKFQARYCKDQPLSFAEDVVNTYRKVTAPKVPRLWYANDEESMAAVEDGRVHESYGARYQVEGNWLVTTLPNQWQKLYYPFPHLGDGKFGQCWKSWQQNAQKQWVTVDMYGGLETENNVQALARGLLCGAMARLERAGMPVVHHCHDEAMVEVPEDQADEKKFAALMTERLPWVEDMGIPVAVETWVGTRYRK